MFKKLVTLLALTLLTWVAPCLFAADDKVQSPAEALAAESVAYCNSTVNNERPTPAAILVEKVNAACALLEKEGRAAFPQFQGKGSPFIFEGTYIVIQSSEGVILMHPVMPKMVGNNAIAGKDKNGKRFAGIMNDVAQKDGEGWVDYYWPKPGTQEVGHKVTFVKKCKMADGTEVVVLSGSFTLDPADVAKLTIH
jgi:cytochrome c